MSTASGELQILIPTNQSKSEAVIGPQDLKV